MSNELWNNAVVSTDALIAEGSPAGNTLIPDDNSKWGWLANKQNSLLNQLVQTVDDAGRSEMVKQWLAWKAQQNWWHYSFANAMLIWRQRPSATQVAGMSAWNKKGRKIKKGEKAIWIWAPNMRKSKDDPDKEEFTGSFHPTTVFDVSQTEGEPLPEKPQIKWWTDDSQEPVIIAKLVKLAEENGISVRFEQGFSERMGGAKGAFSPRAMAIMIDSSMGIQTLIHELAHGLLHVKHQGHVKMETEAEGVMFMVGSVLGLDVSTAGVYLAMTGATAKEVKASLEIIDKTSALIIKAIGVEK